MFVLYFGRHWEDCMRIKRVINHILFEQDFEISSSQSGHMTAKKGKIELIFRFHSCATNIHFCLGIEGFYLIEPIDQLPEDWDLIKNRQKGTVVFNKSTIIFKDIKGQPELVLAKQSKD